MIVKSLWYESRNRLSNPVAYNARRLRRKYRDDGFYAVSRWYSPPSCHAISQHVLRCLLWGQKVGLSQVPSTSRCHSRGKRRGSLAPNLQRHRHWWRLYGQVRVLLHHWRKRPVHVGGDTAIHGLYATSLLLSLAPPPRRRDVYGCIRQRGVQTKRLPRTEAHRRWHIVSPKQPAACAGNLGWSSALPCRVARWFWKAACFNPTIRYVLRLPWHTTLTQSR